MKKRIAPGRLFWVSTFAVGLASPTRGKRRVGDQMKRVDAKWKTAQKRIGALEEELVASYTANKRLTKDLQASREACDRLRAQADASVINGQGTLTPPVASSQQDRPRKRLVVLPVFRHSSTEETIPLPTTPPGGIQVRHLAEKAGASDVPVPRTVHNEVG